MLTGLPFWVQFVKVKPPFAVAVTVALDPLAKEPPPLVVPPLLGDELVVMVKLIRFALSVKAIVDPDGPIPVIELLLAAMIPPW